MTTSQPLSIDAKRDRYDDYDLTNKWQRQERRDNMLKDA
jgi:hypothetical protein